ncbi:MAG: tRNA (adenosine(37)-N6)-threonylcarbamoyltransferase complex dimerization subunit type 1 TsaB [Oscillospiraceae bacterium]|nr:tRNA (adenosine(37)-N6)-threonylcarbamoyltransferase complex dimerization subunit type 1 TsaB [Oscillospiraceae bacterium]
MSNILALDTSALTATAAVIKDGLVAAEVSFTTGLTHSQTIMPMVDYCLKGAGLTPGDIDLYAVSSGPGSFTGLRIGVGTAKAMAYACDKKCVGVPTLLALAHNIAYDGLIVPIMDARRSQVYCAAYRRSGNELTEVLPPDALSVAELCSRIDEKAVFVGDGVEAYMGQISEILKDRAVFAPTQLRLQRAASVGVAALNLEGVSPDELSVIYLRKPQAEREREERLNNNH